MTADKDSLEQTTTNEITAASNASEEKKTEVPHGTAENVGGGEEEEDIPPDFFDDFSNQDFMEGLDIVDTWDDEMQEDALAKEDSGKKESEGRTGGEQKEGSRDSAKGKHTRITFSKEHERRQFKQKNYEQGLRMRDLREKIGRPEDKGGTEARRRDPEKTRRDILRDKDRCAKDKEVRIINEKLKVVETGLVPPGTEMEVDLSEIRNKQQGLKAAAESRNKEEMIRNLAPVLPKLDYRLNKPRYRSRSRSYERFRFRERPFRTRSRSRSRERRSRSRERRRTRERPSPPPKRRLRSRSRSPFYAKNLSRDRKTSGERKFSPKPRRREKEDRSLSPLSDVSDREKWLTRRYRRSSLSPERKRPARRSELEPKEKQSFLEEIHKKLNETTRHSPQVAVQHSLQLQTTYLPVQPPQPVPPVIQPNPFPVVPPQVRYDPSISQYDQQFFIGTCDIPAAPQSVGAPPPPSYVPQPCPAPMSALPPNLHGPHSFNSDCSVSQLLEESQRFAAVRKEKEKKALEDNDKKALAKLLDDKKISLSDFLTITARPSDSRPVNLQHKIDVISRCQDAIKELGGDSKQTGRLFVKPSKRPETPELLHSSPFRKIPLVRLNFTTFTRNPTEESPTYSATILRLLKAIGLYKEPEPEKKEPEPQKPVRQRFRKRKLATVQASDPLHGAKFLMKMCQTDPYKCEVCEARAARKFQEQSVQCAEKTMVDQSTQTVEDSPPLKSKSLSHMTPAQILAELGQEKGEGVEVKGEVSVVVKDELEAGGSLQNMERSVELDHGDKETPQKKKVAEQPEMPDKPWGSRKNNFVARKRLDVPYAGNRGQYFRGARGAYKNFRGGFRRPYHDDDADIYGPNFDDEEEYGHNYGQNEYFNNYDENVNKYGGPPNRRPFYEPPEHVKRKFNRRFL